MKALLLGYLILKLSAYAGWCLVGLNRNSQPNVDRRANAVVLGMLRFVLGLGFGVLIWYATTMINIAMDGGWAGKMTAYISVYVPVRWVEWAVISLFVFKSSRSFAGFIFGGNSTDRLWRLGGIAISCIADVPMILLLGGLPLGRFLC